MKKIVLFLLVFTASGVFAQGEFLNKTNSISGSSISKTSGSSTPSVFAPKTTTSSTSQSKPIEEKPIQFLQSNNFADAGQPVMTKMNKKGTEFNPIYVDKDMSLGVFKTKSQTVRICYRDYSAPDGDVVRIYTKDMMLVPTAILTNDCQYMKLSLLKGENVINFQALNEGSSYPNTGELQVYDENGIIITSNRWGLETGYKGVLTIYRE